MEKTYTVKQLIDMLVKHLQLILTTMFAGLAIAGVLTFFRAPLKTYEKRYNRLKIS